MAACLAGIDTGPNKRVPRWARGVGLHRPRGVEALSASSAHGDGFETSVDQALGLDMAMGGPRARGYLSARRAARWLLDVHDWEDIERVAVEAAQSHEIPEELDLEAVKPTLTGLKVEGRTGLALFKLRGSQARKRLCRNAEVLLSEGKPSTMIFEEGTVRYLVHELLVPQISELFDPDQIEVHTSLAELRVETERSGERMEAAGQLVLDLLSDQELGILRGHQFIGMLKVLLPATQAPLAVALIDALARRITDLAAEGPT